MGNLFQKQLKEEFGFAPTRVKALDKGIDRLHDAIYYLDWNNSDRFFKIGIEKLLKAYAKTEGLEDVMKRRDS